MDATKVEFVPPSEDAYRAVPARLVVHVPKRIELTSTWAKQIRPVVSTLTLPVLVVLMTAAFLGGWMLFGVWVSSLLDSELGKVVASLLGLLSGGAAALGVGHLTFKAKARLERYTNELDQPAREEQHLEILGDRVIGEGGGVFSNPSITPRGRRYRIRVDLDGEPETLLDGLDRLEAEEVVEALLSLRESTQD